jgi:hypothetical protein
MHNIENMSQGTLYFVVRIMGLQTFLQETCGDGIGYLLSNRQPNYILGMHVATRVSKITLLPPMILLFTQLNVIQKHQIHRLD